MNTLDALQLECAVAAACGGCPHHERSYALQLGYKRELVLKLLAEIELVPPQVTVHSAPQPLGYRRRMRMAVDAHGRARFFNAQKGLDCRVLEPSLRRLCQSMVEFGRQHPTGLEGYTHLELRVADLDGRPSLFLAGGRSTKPVPVALLRQRIHPRLLVATEETSEGWQRVQVLDKVYAYSPGDAFLQVNAAVNAQLVDGIVRRAKALRVSQFWDLCCGIGNYTLPLLHQGLSGMAVELQGNSVRALKQAAAEQGYAVDVVSADVADWLKQRRQSQAAAPLVVANPPRAGLGRAAHLLAAMDVEQMLLISCNPTTLCRDLVVLRAAGFAVRALDLFDMFPWTRHIETLVWLSRGSVASPQH